MVSFQQIQTPEQDSHIDGYIKFMADFGNFADKLRTGNFLRISRQNMTEITIDSLKLNVTDLKKWYTEIYETVHDAKLLNNTQNNSCLETIKGIVRLSKYMEHGLALFHSTREPPVMIKMKDSTTVHYLNLVGIFTEMDTLTNLAISSIPDDNGN